MNRPGMAVVMKPPGWEADTTDREHDHGEHRGQLLSHYMQQRYPQADFPLVHQPSFGYGFLHRLDIPSSGLLLMSTTFEGLYALRWQLNTHLLVREYFTLCHDFGRPARDVD